MLAPGIARRLGAALLCAGALLCARGTAAHHSFAMYDNDRQVKLAGTVAKFQWTNPHVYLWLYSDNGKGGEDVYGFEFVGGPNGLARSGWTKRTLNPGDKVTVKFNPLRDGRTGGMFVNVTLPDGKVMTARG